MADYMVAKHSFIHSVMKIIILQTHTILSMHGPSRSQTFSQIPIERVLLTRTSFVINKEATVVIHT